MNSKKIAAIVKWENPGNLKEVYIEYSYEIAI
jgi:hypothetical protein